MVKPSRTLASLVVTLLVITGCSNDSELSVEEAHEQFCNDVSDYIDSIGQYGGLFQDVDLTVGDVRNAADELEPGLEAVRASLEEFQTAVAADPVPGVGVELVSPESLEAVEEAEEAFARASQFDDRTLVTEAGVEFVSAAYQLEVAWFRLFLDAGCLDGDAEAQAQAQQWISDYVSALQTDLRTLGYYNGDIDGVFGPLTVEAIEQFQTANGLPVTGLVDPATQAAMQLALGQRESAQVAGLQAIMIATGHYDGEVDGIWSPQVEAALIALQRDLGVPATGQIDVATLRALEDALAASGEEPEVPSTTTPEEPAPTTTVPAETTTAPEATTTTAAAPTTTAPVSGGVLEILAEAGHFSTFLDAVETAGLTETLSGAGPFTIFAPTDEAFAAAGELPTDPEALSQLVLYHVVEGSFDGFAIQEETELATAQGSAIAVSVENGVTVLNGQAQVTVTNLVAANGLAHAINAVLTPQG